MSVVEKGSRQLKWDRGVVGKGKKGDCPYV